MLVIGCIISLVSPFCVLVHRSSLPLQSSLLLVSVASGISLARTFFKATNPQPMGTCSHTPSLIWESNNLMIIRAMQLPSALRARTLGQAMYDLYLLDLGTVLVREHAHSQSWSQPGSLVICSICLSCMTALLGTGAAPGKFLTLQTSGNWERHPRRRELHEQKQRSLEM